MANDQRRLWNPSVGVCFCSITNTTANLQWFLFSHFLKNDTSYDSSSSSPSTNFYGYRSKKIIYLPFFLETPKWCSVLQEISLVRTKGFVKLIISTLTFFFIILSLHNLIIFSRFLWFINLYDLMIAKGQFLDAIDFNG